MSFLTSSDLFFNLRGTGWSSSSRQSTPPPSVTSALAKALLKFTVLDSDVSHYLLHFMSPSIVKTGGGNMFDASIPFLPRTVLLATYVGGMWVCLRSVFTYSATKAVMLIGADRSSVSQPPTCLCSSADRGWGHLPRIDISGASAGTSSCDTFFSCSGPGARPVQLARCWDARPARSFADFVQDVGFFALMRVGAILENAFQRATGLPVRGWFCWLWTMIWTLLWDGRDLLLVIDSWDDARSLQQTLSRVILRLGIFLIDGAVFSFSR